MSEENSVVVNSNADGAVVGECGAETEAFISKLNNSDSDSCDSLARKRRVVEEKVTAAVVGGVGAEKVMAVSEKMTTVEEVTEAVVGGVDAEKVLAVREEVTPVEDDNEKEVTAAVLSGKVVREVTTAIDEEEVTTAIKKDVEEVTTAVKKDEEVTSAKHEDEEEEEVTAENSPLDVHLRQMGIYANRWREDVGRGGVQTETGNPNRILATSAP